MATAAAAGAGGAARARRRFSSSLSILRRSNHTPTNQISNMVTAGAAALSRGRGRQHTSPLDFIHLQLGPGLHPSLDCTALLNNNNKPQIQPGRCPSDDLPGLEQTQHIVVEVHTAALLNNNNNNKPQIEPGRSPSDDLPGLEQTQHMVVEVDNKKPQCPSRPPAFGCCGRWKSMALRPSNGFGLHKRISHMDKHGAGASPYNPTLELIRRTETEDVMLNMCPSFTDMFHRIDRMRVLRPKTALLYEKVIVNHPSMMSTQGSVILMRDADMILRHQYKYAPKTSKIRDIANRHPLLRCWHQFNQQLQQQHELARQKKISENDSRSTIQNNGAERGKFNRVKIGSGLVGLCRDGVNHPYEPSVKQMLKRVNASRKCKISWPLTIKEVVDVMEINLPGFKPMLVEGLLSYLDWAYSSRRYCWPRDDRCDSLTIPVRISTGTQAKLLKLGNEDVITYLTDQEMRQKGGSKGPKEDADTHVVKEKV
uniref:Uncharacterized protein n=1 Tax=Oryza glumipatula TaxID=40148 RepID=A0A0E0BMV6_9ORYZ